MWQKIRPPQNGRGRSVECRIAGERKAPSAGQPPLGSVLVRQGPQKFRCNRLGMPDCAAGTPTRIRHDRGPSVPRHNLVTSNRVSSSSTTSLIKSLHELTDPSLPCDRRLWKNPNAERAMSAEAAPKRLSEGSSFDTSPSVGRWTQQMTISFLRHPAGARQMTVMNQTSSFGFTLGINAKDDSHCFAPVSALVRSVKQAEVGHEMALVIGRERYIEGGTVIEGRCGHGDCSHTKKENARE